MGLAEIEKDQKEVTGEFAKMATIPLNSEAVLRETTKSVEACRVEADRGFSVRTYLLIALGIVEVLRNKPFHVLVTNLTRNVVTVSTHSRLAMLTERRTVVVNMTDDIDTDQMVTQADSIDACPVYKGKVIKEDLAPQHEVIVQQDSKINWKHLWKINDNYDRYQPQFESVMTQYASIRDGHVGTDMGN